MRVNLAIGTAFAAYFIVLALIAWRAYQHTTTVADFVLGRRRLSSSVAALSAGASDMSGWLLLGLPGLAVISPHTALWTAVGLTLGTYANWRIIDQPLRLATAHHDDALTLPEYFERRFDDHAGTLRLVAALCILVFFTLYASAGLVAGGKLFNTVFGLDYPVAVTVGAVIVVLYTLYGGFRAVSWTDALQALIIVIALIAIPVVLYWTDGAAFARTIELTTTLVTQAPQHDRIVTVSALAWGFGYMGQPHILARFMAIKDPQAVPAARRTAVAWTGLCLAGALLVGNAGASLVEPGLLAADAERVFIHIVRLLLHPLAAGICLAAILAAIMSTIDSQLLVASVALARDVRLTRRQNHHGLGANRLAVAAVCGVATLLALRPGSSVLKLVADAWAAFGASFGPVLIGSLYWPQLSRRGALAGMLTGAVSVVIWGRLSGGIFELYEIVPGMLASFVAMLICTSFECRAPQATRSSPGGGKTSRKKSA